MLEDTVVLICLFLMISDIEHLFVYLVGYLYIFGKMSIWIFCQFFIQIVWFILPLSGMNCYVYVGYYTFIRYMIYNYFLPFHRLPFNLCLCLFILFIVYFAMSWLFSLMQSFLFIFAFVVIACDVKSKKSKNVIPKFSSMSLMILGIMIKYSVHFELVFVCGIREESSFILLHVADQFSQSENVSCSIVSVSLQLHGL